MNEWIEMARKLRERINPSTMPVAVSFLAKEDQIPQKARKPLRDLGVKMAPCQGAAMARLYGWTVAFTRADVGCAIAAHTYGWERVSDPAGPVDFFTRMNYAADDASAVRIFEGFRLLEAGHDPIVLYSPLEKAVMPPDVVLVYVNPAQMMRLIHGCTFLSGEPIQGSFSGRAASCTEGVIGAWLDQDAKVVVPGNGDRVWAACQDHEMVMAIHAARLAELVEGLERTHEKGIRYPVPAYMRFQPEVAFSTPLADIFKGRKERP